MPTKVRNSTGLPCRTETTVDVLHPCSESVIHARVDTHLDLALVDLQQAAREQRIASDTSRRALIGRIMPQFAESKQDSSLWDGPSQCFLSVSALPGYSGIWPSVSTL
jgi:hypothetical protein